MKICIICAEYPPGPIGGVGTCVQTAARWLSANGHQVKVIGTYPQDYPAPDYHVDQGVEVYRIKFKPGKISWVPARYKLYKQVKNWIKNNEVDIVEANDSFGWFAFWGKLSVPLVIRANGTETSFGHELGIKVNRVTNLMEKQSYMRADDYCAASKYIARINEKYFQLTHKHTVIYNCLPQVSVVTASAEREKNLVVFSGSLIAKKGVKELIEASLLLHSRNIKHQLVLNGKDHVDKEGRSTKASLLEMIPENLKAYFTFNGHVTREKLYDYYTRATLAIFPSYMEAFAFAPMEAMVNGCPTIFTTRVSGPELIDTGVDGILVEPSDIKQIADSIQWCIEHPTEAKRIGDAGREKIKSTFSVEVVMPQNVAFYERVIKQFKENKG